MKPITMSRKKSWLLFVSFLVVLIYSPALLMAGPGLAAAGEKCFSGLHPTEDPSEQTVTPRTELTSGNRSSFSTPTSSSPSSDRPAAEARNQNSLWSRRHVFLSNFKK
jgi:hypothetical protein